MSLFLPIIALLVSAAFTRGLIQFALSRGILDVPNERSSHTMPTPRGGGLGIVAGVATGVVVLCFSANVPIGYFAPIAGALAVAGVGWWDDRQSLSPRFRLVVQFVSASVTLGLLGFSLASTSSVMFWLLPVAIFYLVWITNLTNFMDGIDGIAGLQTALCGAFAALLCGHQGFEAASALYFLLSAAAIGFLIFNWSPAKIFMGDVGSVFVGFFYASIGLVVAVADFNLFLAINIVFGCFIADATWTLFTRVLRRKKVSQAHRSHCYQRLVHYFGYSHSKTSLLYGLVTSLWLFPLGFALIAGVLAPVAAITLASIPLLSACWWIRAGFD